MSGDVGHHLHRRKQTIPATTFATRIMATAQLIEPKLSVDWPATMDCTTAPPPLGTVASRDAEDESGYETSTTTSRHLRMHAPFHGGAKGQLPLCRSRESVMSEERDRVAQLSHRTRNGSSGVPVLISRHLR